MRTIIHILLVTCLSNCLYAQDRNELAKAYYVKAEEAYNSGDFENTIKYTEKAQQQLGQPNSKILYLTIKGEYGLLQKGYTSEVAKNEQLAFDKFFEITNKSNYPEDKYAEMIKLKIDFEDLQEGKEIVATEKQKKIEVESGKPKIFTFTEQQPEPEYDFQTYLGKNLHYPKQAKKDNITGRVIVRFVVNEDGTLSDFQIVRGIGNGCDEEALRVMKQAPKWKAGKQNGKAIKVNFSQPITFSL